MNPRGLTREQAAEYLSLCPSAFDQWVKAGRLPGPIAGTKRWDRKAIDLALDRASGIQSAQGSAFKAWRAGHEGSDARR